MKIVAVLGSPRPTGNSNTLAQRFLETARQQGAETQVFMVNQMQFKGCQGCGSCKTKTDYCVVEDDLTPVYDAIREADLLLLASPVYFGDLSGQLKCFFDRFFAFADSDFSSRLRPGKKAVVILTQGHPDGAMFADIFPRYQQWFNMLGFAETHLVRGLGLGDPGAAAARPELLAQAADAARQVAP
ncbi:MAG: flavodoxin family protein [Deltaproteobacteria bacterium]|nr:flavodoxin family protein [Deltaproteobacteria bacterium]